MAFLKRRDRIVVFRLTQDEYKRLQRACTRTGARNLSDYTRAQLLDPSGPRGSGGWLEGQMSRFDKRLTEVQSAVRQMERLLRQMKET